MTSIYQHVVYGPVHSRRLGASLGIDLMPSGVKVCNFNCAYCQYGWTRLPIDALPPPEAWPAPRTVAEAVTKRLWHARARGERIDRLTIAGHGEPTLHPAFDRVIAELGAVRDRVSPALPLAVLSNASTLDRDEVRAALARVDERYMKLDAGDATTLRQVNGARVAFDRLIDGLRRLPNVVIQAMFVSDPSGRIDNASEEAVGAWLEAVASVGPRAVHVYTLDRAPAFGCLQPVGAERLEAIGARVREAGIEALIFC